MVLEFQDDICWVVKPSDAEASTFWGNWVNSMSVDARVRHQDINSDSIVYVWSIGPCLHDSVHHSNIA